jgi:hypothetical protein
MMTNRIETDAVRERAAGRWLEVLVALAPALAPALARIGRHVPCPVHGGQDGFRLFPDVAETGGGICNTCGTFPDGFALLMWVNGWSFRDALLAVAGALGITEVPMPTGRPPQATPQLPERDPAAAAALQRVWEGSLDPNNRQALPLQRYLQRRGLAAVSLDGAVLRFHSALGYWERDDHDQPQCVGRFPALLARVSAPDGTPVTLHRTYLTADGRKAPVAAPRKLMGYPGDRLVGGAIRLFPAAPVLGVAEGIETALAVHRRTAMPVWSAVSAGLLARWEPPTGTSLVVVWADRDRSGAGETAAHVLRERLLRRGFAVAVHVPPGPIPAGVKSIDWADVWTGSPERAAA